MYEKVDKELLGYVEDVLLNRCENSTERMLEFAALLDPKSKPLAVKKLADESAGPVLNLPAKINPTPAGVYNAEVRELPTVPTYKPYRCAFSSPSSLAPCLHNLQLHNLIVLVDEHPHNYCHQLYSFLGTMAACRSLEYLPSGFQTI